MPPLRLVLELVLLIHFVDGCSSTGSAAHEKSNVLRHDLLKVVGVILVNHAHHAAAPTGARQATTNGARFQCNRDKFIQLWVGALVQVTTAFMGLNHQLAKSFNVLRRVANFPILQHTECFLVNMLCPLVQFKFLNWI